ncbi:MAG: response regulator [Leptolyngbya sp. SIO1E4]|nr:response regulator [Leptolyngbya sp. SIO1E4]
MKLTELAELLEPADKQFDGHLVLNDHQVTWTLNFVQGQLLYAVDGRHAVRRWNRTLKKYFPNCNWQADTTQSLDHQSSWQIRSLDQGISQQQLSLIRAKLLIRTIIQECLFELSYCTELKSDWKPMSFPISRTCQSIALSSWEMQMTLNKVSDMQQQWQAGGLEQLNPTLSPVLKGTAEAQSLPISDEYLKGDFTLWDIAGYLDKSLAEIAKPLVPLIQTGTLELQSVPDLSLPLVQPSDKAPSAEQSVKAKTPQAAPAIPSTPAAASKPSKAPTDGPPEIACIDDSPVLAHSLKKILVSAGYRVLIIQEPMRGFSQLIEHRPSLILLDLMLPNADGYSVCKFLRDTPVFKETPIIILTGQNKPIDRARARLAGATEFLVKPPQPEQLLQMIRDHLD